MVTKWLKLQPIQNNIHPLPFPQVLSNWYERQYALSIHNIRREEVTQMVITDFDERGNTIFINRSQVWGTLHDNVYDVVKTLQDGRVKHHVMSIINVGEFIIANGPVVKTQDVGQVYIAHKNLLSKRRKSMELYDIFAKCLNPMCTALHTLQKTAATFQLYFVQSPLFLKVIVMYK